MKTLAFLNLRNRHRDADHKDLSDYKYEVGDEIIVELDDETQMATTNTVYGSFRFGNLRDDELSPYASLEELTGLRFVDGHYEITAKLTRKN